MAKTPPDLYLSVPVSLHAGRNACPLLEYRSFRYQRLTVVLPVLVERTAYDT